MFGGDLFFSGHTGLPFLIALIYWDHKTYRIIFITLAAIFGSVALMGHLHYSIDVFAAFFITYAIYHIAMQIFKKDKDLDVPFVS
jgi:membrane-associated phospholipid phosphatase